MLKKRKEAVDYFDNFAASAECSLRAAELLNELILDFHPEMLPAKMDEIHRCEHKADIVKHTTTDRLAKEFLPPIDREDIMSLMQELDDVADAIDDIMRLLCLFNVKTLNENIKPFSDLLVRCSKALLALVSEFKHFKKSVSINKHIVSINSLETEGDTLHFTMVNRLFCAPNITLDIIIWKDIFDAFEICYDSCEHVADVIEGVILKNS